MFDNLLEQTHEENLMEAAIFDGTALGLMLLIDKTFTYKVARRIINVIDQETKDALDNISGEFIYLKLKQSKFKWLKNISKAEPDDDTIDLKFKNGYSIEIESEYSSDKLEVGYIGQIAYKRNLLNDTNKRIIKGSLGRVLSVAGKVSNLKPGSITLLLESYSRSESTKIILDAVTEFEEDESLLEAEKHDLALLDIKKGEMSSILALFYHRFSFKMAEKVMETLLKIGYKGGKRDSMAATRLFISLEKLLGKPWTKNIMIKGRKMYFKGKNGDVQFYFQARKNDKGFFGAYNLSIPNDEGDRIVASNKNFPQAINALRAYMRNN